MLYRLLPRDWKNGPLVQVVLPALLIAWLAWITGNDGRPVGVPATAAPASDLRTIPNEVFLAGHNISGWRETQVSDLLKRWAEKVEAEPVDAFLDPTTKGRVPHLNGMQLDIEGTLERLRISAAGEHVPLVFQDIPLATTISDLPPGPIYQGNPGKHAVTFTINVAWGNAYLPEMLRTLKKNDVKVTFFLVGEWAERFPDAAMAIAVDGHEIASHGYSTVAFGSLGPDQATEQITRAEEAIKATTGRKPSWFSPHKGEFSPLLLKEANARGYETILWSVDTVDWSNPGVDRMLRKVLSDSHNGAIILMHPTEQTVHLLDPLVKGLRKQGYRIVTLGTLLSPSPLARD